MDKIIDSKMMFFHAVQTFCSFIHTDAPSKKSHPHVWFCSLWRWKDLSSPVELQHIATCEFACDLNKPDICIQPYHYTRVERPGKFLFNCDQITYEQVICLFFLSFMKINLTDSFKKMSLILFCLA